MLSRTAQRLETTLLLSRQGLPRPARLACPFSTPSKSAHAPASATAQLPANDYTQYLHETFHNRPSTSTASTPKVMGEFLSRKMIYTILPPPLPSDEHYKDRLFTDTTTQDQLAIMNACLQNLYNVPRARTIFNRLREDIGSTVLHRRVYNAILSAYVGMARKDEAKALWWLQEAWNLFGDMSSGKESIQPDSTTYATMLSAWHQFNPKSSTPVEVEDALDYGAILNLIVSDKQNIPLLEVIADHEMPPPEQTAEIVKILSRIAIKNRDLATVNALSKAYAIATGEEIPDMPEVLPTTKFVKQTSTDATGVGTEIVPFNIKNLRDHLAQIAYARQLLPEDLQSRQKHLELCAYDIAHDRHNFETTMLEELGIDSKLKNKVLQTYMFNWHTLLKDRLALEIDQIRTSEVRQRKNERQHLSPYLTLVAAERLSIITILEVMRLCGSGGITSGMKTARTLISLGKAVELEYKARVCRENDIPIPIVKRANENVFTEFGYKNIHQRRIAAVKHNMDGESWTTSWSQSTRARIGALLLESLMDVAIVKRTMTNKETGEIISEDQPAFQHSYEYIRGTKLGTIMLNPAVADRISQDQLKGTIHPRYLPMVMPPKPWIDLEDGGYIYSKSRLMRFKDSREQEEYLKEAIKKGNVELVFEGLNVLGNTPWKINKKIFNVVLEVWNSGKRVGKIPPAVFDQPEPVVPPNADTDMQARSVHMQRQRQWTSAAANNHSDRCSVNYKIEIARAFADDTIYFPHNLDFRGRAYPLPPHLNHIGDDLSRGLLMFAEAKPLGERGLRWLKIHLANLYGYDKASFEERVEWVMARLDDIYDSARNPLTGRCWWMKADDPWQCLAACFELQAALESGNPLTYESRLPVHQDGTCNGLQHYAALGGDVQGAQQVNLSAADRPSDVYTFVGSKVEKIIDRDAENGDPWAKILQGKITRKVVKQTVMTTVYGVTFVGARDQIEKQLKDRGDIPQELCWRAAAYLAKQVLICIGDTFTGAKGIQTWLNLCARLVSKSISPDRFNVATAESFTDEKEAKARRGSAIGKRKTRGKAVGGFSMSRFKKEQMSSVIWTTPLGLPIVQPYRKITRKQIMTNIQSIYISDPNIPNEVNSLKQASAFPPNFIHSLDATHMMLTSLECNRRGLSFASVHDSYWTHASSIDTMSEVIRDTFIMLHSSDVLENLNQEFKTRYKGFKIPLFHLMNSRSGFHKNLVEAGSRINVKPEQAADLAPLENLLVVSDEIKSSVDEAILLSEDDVPVSGDDTLSASDTQALLDSLESEVSEDRPTPTKTTQISAEDKAEQAALHKLVNKFVDLTAVLPPLPKKGSFRVEDIKKSQYFFS